MDAGYTNLRRWPYSGECNRKSLFRRALEVIKAQRLQPFRLSEKAEAKASNQTQFGPTKTTQVQETSVPPVSPFPTLEDSNYLDSEPVELGLLFPDYIREHYPTVRRFTGLPRLTLSMSDWNTRLMAIAEDEGAEDEGYQSRFSDPDSEPDFTSVNDSGSSSRDSSPPLTPMSGQMPLPPAFFVSAGKLTSSYEVNDRDNAAGVAL
ncbi:hypothetical protein FRC09_020421 [Ceratobasidium sp. 395]|nr:hypothetical protein FRC09_020421 [Ceratobasidium sp. 395]